ncbi:MAG: bacteriocin immunity protein [Moraxellaceae bacterium]|nr:bacteriocin immunity protein [Moraxellaceae bacterium]
MLDKEYLTHLITKIINSSGSEEELDKYIDELKKLSPITDVTDLIFYSKEEHISADQIADLILNFKPEYFLKEFE